MDQKDKEECFREIYYKHFSTVYKISLLYWKNTSESEDLVQEVFIKLLNHDREFTDPDHVKAWLIRVTKNLCKDNIKNFWRSKRVDMEKLPELSDASPINISSTDKGYRITAESVFGDEKFAYVLFSIQREDEKKLRGFNTLLSGPLWTMSSHPTINNGQSEYEVSSFNTYTFDSEINTDRKEYFLHAYNIVSGTEDENNLIGSKLHLEMDKISLGFLEFGRKGKWEFDIPLEYKDISKIYELDKEFDYKGEKIKLDKIHFSDLDMAIYLKFGDKALQKFSEEFFDINFKMKDGRVIDSKWDSGGGDLAGSQYFYTISLIESEKIIPEDISEIHFGDIAVPILLERQ